MALSVSDFLNECEQHGRATVNDHISQYAADHPGELDYRAARSLRTRLQAALRAGGTHHHLLGDLVLPSRSSRGAWAGGVAAADDILPAPTFSPSTDLSAVDAVITSNSFALPGTSGVLQTAQQEISRAPRNVQRAYAESVEALGLERRLAAVDAANAEQRASDLSEQLRDARNDKVFFQTMMVEMAGGKRRSGVVQA